jgi:flavodoxin
MKIGIIVYSQTGNTLSVAEKLEKKLSGAGHSVKLERVTASGDARPHKKVELMNKPHVDKYEALVFGSPVMAFSLAAPMKSYLEQLGSLKGKQVACFVTKGLPGNWTGGNKAIGIMKKTCESKGAIIIGTEIIKWRGKNLDQEIDGAVDRLSGLFRSSNLKPAHKR